MKIKKKLKYDSNDYLSSIDTMYLNSVLTNKTIQELLNSFKYFSIELNESNHYKYHINLIEHFGVYIKLCNFHQKNLCEIQLQSKFTTNQSSNNPIILFLLNKNNFKITRLDYAIDFKIPYKERVSYNFKRHGLQKEFNYTTGKQIGSTANTRKKTLTSHYDRNEKNSNTTNIEYSNRFEIKMFFYSYDCMYISDLDTVYRIVANRLKNELFIQNILEIKDFNKVDISHITKAMRKNNENYFQRNLTESKRKNLRNKFKKNRFELENVFLNDINLFDFLIMDNNDVDHFYPKIA